MWRCHAAGSIFPVIYTAPHILDCIYYVNGSYIVLTVSPTIFICSKCSQARFQGGAGAGLSSAILDWPPASPLQSACKKMQMHICKWYLYCFNSISTSSHLFSMFHDLFCGWQRQQPIPSPVILVLASLPQLACKKMQMHVCKCYLYCFDFIPTNSHPF